MFNSNNLIIMVNYEIEMKKNFNEAVNNTMFVLREARHMDVNDDVCEWINNTLIPYIHDVNFKVEFVDDVENYLRNKMLDLLDVLKNMIENEKLEGDDFKVINSIYDIFRTCYFSEV